METKDFSKYEKIFPTKPYERPGSSEFLEAVKSQDKKLVEAMLENCKWYALDFDKMR